MDDSRFDQIARSLAVAGISRRRVVRGLLAGGATRLAAGALPEVSAKKKKKKKNKPCGNGCSGGTLCCGERCVNVLADPNNCGACGNACAPDEACTNGECVFCRSPKAVCDTRCVDLQTDPNNCGQCGVICPKDPSNRQRDFVCEQGQCKCTGPVCDNGRCCPAGFTICVGGGAGCCPDGFPVSCPGGKCCPAGYGCGGTCGQDCCK